MENTIVELIQNFSYFAVFFLIFIENLFPPIPSEIILSFAGFLVVSNDMNLYLMILSSTLGSYFGAEALYYLGYYLQPEKFQKYLMKFRFDLKSISNTQKWFNRYGNITVFICRFIPIVRSLISIPAGVTKMKHTPFVLYTILGSLIWNTILICIGMLLGKNYSLISHYMDQYAFLFIFFMIVIFILIKQKKNNT